MSESCTFGYARVSSNQQNLDRQIEALTRIGIDERNIITDMKSGKNFDREGYQLLKTQLLRKGDLLILTELDRLGRSYIEIKKEFQELTDMGISIRFLDNEILGTWNKSDIEKKLISNLMFELLAYISEKERVKIRQRCAEGIENAKRKGIRFGRPPIPAPDNWSDVYGRWNNGEITAVKAMELTKLKRTTFYKFVRRERPVDDTHLYQE